MKRISYLGAIILFLFSGAAAAQEKPPAEERRNSGVAQARHERPARFPRRIWAACDFEAQTIDYGWFGPVEKSNVPQYAGNVTALGVGERPYQNVSALMTGVNPVPGPRMGSANKLCVRYFLRGATEATFQHFSLSSEDNQHVRVTGLRQEEWSDLTIDFSADAARNDGSPGAFGDGERMDDLKVFVGKPNDGREYELILDDVIFFTDDESDAQPSTEPFPNRVIYLAAFDTGPQEKYWPGDFELAEREVPAGAWWKAARAVPRAAGENGKWIRLQIDPPRPVGEHTKLRFRYHLHGAAELTAQIFDATDQDNRHVVLRNLTQDAWSTATVDFTRNGRRNDGGQTAFAAGHMVDDLFFFVPAPAEGSVELYVDEVVLYDAGPIVESSSSK